MFNSLKKRAGLMLAVVVTAMATAVPAHATLPVEVGAAFTSIGTDVTEAIGYGWVLFLLVTAGLVAFKIVGKVIGRST